MIVEPIGIFYCSQTYPYDAARQGAVSQDNSGRIEMFPGQQYEQAIEDLEGFSHIWLLFQFHKNDSWKPKVMPPRGDRKVGVFASRAPYRPNPIGMSCVQLGKVDGRMIEVFGHDLLNETPILDIKPYLPYADSFPDATQGWLDEIEEGAWQIDFNEESRQQLEWLETHGLETLRGFLKQQLSDEPTNIKKKRLTQMSDKEWEIAYRTWRVKFEITVDADVLKIMRIYSGYTKSELADAEDRYQDKELHREYNVFYQT
jgi:tRNA-Thr(GGU) m(6)t(6)A37 methyltransferase TsaA